MSGRRAEQEGVYAAMNISGLARYAALCLVLTTPAFTAATQAPATVAIVVNPAPFATVEQAAVSETKVNWWDGDDRDDTACTECFAATELRRFLAACTGRGERQFSLIKPGRLPQRGDVFLLGSRKSNPLIDSFGNAAGSKLVSDASESFHIRAFHDTDRTICIIEGSDRVGTLYGVYAYLEHLGIRFFGLGEQGTVYPGAPVELPNQMDVMENPCFLTRGFWAWEDRGNEEFFLWMARNRMNFWTAEEAEIPFLKKLGLKLTAGGHIIQDYFLNPHAEYPYNYREFERDDDKPADPYAPSRECAGDTNGDGTLSYFEAHPEWYGLHKGKRTDRVKDVRGVNYCTSNRDATLELAKNLIQSLIDGRWRHVDIVNFWMSDVGWWCQCEDCEKLGTPTDRLLLLVHEVFTEMQQARVSDRLKRAVQLTTLAYIETLAPPTRALPAGFDYENCFVTYFPIRRCYVHSLADPSCTEINRSQLENYQGWAMGAGRLYTGPMFIGEYYNVSSIKSLPVVYSRILAVDIPWYYRTGARHFHYMHTPTRLWGTWTLNQWLLARLLWNPEAEADALLNEYFRLYYPTTSQRARTFYRYLEEATANIKPFKHSVPGYSLRGELSRRSRELFPLDHLRYYPHHPARNDGPDVVEMMEAMHRARQEIDAALVECADTTERARLLEDERRFAYGEAMFLFYYHLVRLTMFHNQHEEALARREFVRLEQSAEQLRAVTDLVQVASTHANAQNGLDATQVVAAYEFFKKEYGGD